MGYNHTDQKEAYKLGSDGSIQGNLSCEVVSPILTNFTSLKNVCGVLNRNGAEVNQSCGLHVHFGVANFSCHAVGETTAIADIWHATKLQGWMNFTECPKMKFPWSAL